MAVVAADPLALERMVAKAYLIRAVLVVAALLGLPVATVATVVEPEFLLLGRRDCFPPAAAVVVVQLAADSAPTAGLFLFGLFLRFSLLRRKIG